MRLFLTVLLLSSSALCLEKLVIGRLGKSITNVQWTDCDGTGTPYIQLTDLKLSGNLVIGGNIQIHAAGNVKQSFFAKSFDLSVTVNGARVFGGNYAIPGAKPSVPGPSSTDVTEPLTLPPPAGSYKVTSKLKDGNGYELQCFLVSFTVQ